MEKSAATNIASSGFESEWVELSIAKRFENIVALYPQRLAAKMRECTFTYSQLNRTANRIAHAVLSEMGPGSEPVAIVCEHGIDIIAAILGVLKAGKFYVAIDPSFPPERVGYILKDAQAKLIVTNHRNADLASSQASNTCALLNIDGLDGRFAADNPEVTVAADDLVLIGYTSGSTGVPKGVVATHRTVAQTIRSAAERKRIRIDDRLTLLQSLAFGSGHGHLYIALLTGASVFPFDVKAEGVNSVVQWLREEKITAYHSSPSLFRQVAESLDDQRKLPDLRLVHLSGAPVSRRDFELYRDHFGLHTWLEFGMGSTEARGICSATVDRTFVYPDEGTPIGYPQPHNDVLLLDDNGRQVALGEIGEVAVKGRNLSAGYWNQFDRTESKFQSAGSGERIFLTGDLGRMLPDGFIVHLGRKDLMVKIRGFRVDFSEVERALLEHPAIRDAGVRAWEREDGEKYLAAYVVPRPDARPNVSEIRRFLDSKLPDYMIPTAVQFVEALPLTNGKLNRQELPEPARLRPALTEPYVEPRNPTERTLAEIWSEVLQIDDIGLHDNFFDLGGHSLAATRILSRVLDCFRVELSLELFFESPTLEGFALNVEYVLRQERSATNLPLVSVPRENHLPASFGQRALWLHEQLAPGSPAYNLHSVYRLSGDLDAQLLERSINQIVSRHEVLRTVFEAVDGQPVQRILPTMKIELEVVDLSGLSSKSSQESEVRRLVGALTEGSFDLARGPLLRSALLKLDHCEHVFIVGVHHIVFDGWSIGIFFRELSQIYNDFRNGKASSLPDLGIQYADFAVWQRERLGEANLRGSLDYWKAQLDHLPRTRLPGRRSQRAANRDSTKREEFSISAELLNGLNDLADRSRTTLFMVLLAAWNVALYRYTGQTDIAIGTFVSGRSHPAVEGLIGYFLNLLVLRSDLSGNPTFGELLARVRKACVDALAHQDLPFEKLVAELRPARHVNDNPLVQATFALQNTPSHSLDFTGISARALDISAGIVRPFDLHLYIIEEEASLRGYVAYNDNLLEADVIRGLVGHLKNLLEAVAADPDQRISAVTLLTEAERHRLLVEWNDTQAEYPKDKCVHEWFETQVATTPDVVAVIFENRRLTYRELNRRANRVAHYLRRQGVGPDVLVSLFMERSLEMAIAILAVLKAGGAYLPIDPDWPPERIGFVLADARVKLVLTQESLRAAVNDFAAEIVCLDGDLSRLSDESDENPSPTALGRHAAYVIYTSGSTGTPKGVVNIHDGLLNRIQWMQQRYHLTASDRVLQKTPCTFDVSVWEFLWPLTSGASLVLARPGGQRDSAYLVQLIESRQITTVHFVPSMLDAFVRQPGVEQCTSLKRVFCSGEALSHDLQQRFFERSSAALYNLYGPTEASIDVTAWECRRDCGGTVVPIGRPIANTQIYILDGELQPVPIGVAGELHVGGAGLARGYLNRPDLTAEKFIPNPFRSEAGARLYRTGDLARYLPDGNIEFLGRIDDQVKIRGYRIELGEIECVLRQHPTVCETVVLAREDNPGEKRLVGYVVGADAKVDELRSYLKQKIPAYMVPSIFVCLDAFPLNPNGKVDRKALPAPDQTRPETATTYVAPGTPTEEILAEIWAEVLKLDKVGVHDNFFELGGHSLLAAQVVARLGSTLKLEIPLRLLFEAPTIQDLAQRIAAYPGNRTGGGEILSELQTPAEEETQAII